MIDDLIILSQLNMSKTAEKRKLRMKRIDWSLLTSVCTAPFSILNETKCSNFFNERNFQVNEPKLSRDATHENPSSHCEIVPRNTFLSLLACISDVVISKPIPSGQYYLNSCQIPPSIYLHASHRSVVVRNRKIRAQIVS